MKCSLAIPSCFITPCPIATYMGTTMRSVNAHETTLLMQPADAGRDITELVTRPEGARGHRVQTHCSSDAFILDPAGPFTLRASRQPRIPASMRYLGIATNRRLYNEPRTVEGLMLASHFIVDTYRNDTNALELHTRYTDPLTHIVRSVFYLRPPALPDMDTAQPTIDLPQGTYRIVDEDARLWDVVYAMSSIVPELASTEHRFIPVRNGQAILTIAFVDGTHPKVRLKYVSCNGTTFSDSFAIDPEKKPRLIALLS